MSEIIPNVVVSMPSQLFTMARSFKACSNGRIYIGKIDTDPTIPENQIQVYMERENGDLVPAPQPIIINAAGFPVYNGQIAKFVTVEGHSMAVYDSYGTQQHYYPNVLKYDPDRFKEKLAQGNGSGYVGYDGGSIPSKYSSDSTVQGALDRLTERIVYASKYGIKADGVTDDTQALQSLSRAVSAMGYPVIRVVFPQGVSLVGAQDKAPGFGFNYSYRPSYYKDAGNTGWFYVSGRLGKTIIDAYGYTIKLKSMNHGAFDPVNGAIYPSESPFHDSDYMAWVGHCAAFKNCGDVLVLGLETDGSAREHEWGGKYGDSGWQCMGFGIWAAGNQRFKADGVNCHDAVCDGIYISQPSEWEPDGTGYVLLTESDFHNNRRQGITLAAGENIKIKNVRAFNIGRYANNAGVNYSWPESCLDIESEGGKIENVIVEDCQFTNAGGYTYVAYSFNNPVENSQFLRCLFRTNSSIPAQVFSSLPNESFIDCIFEGSGFEFRHTNDGVNRLIRCKFINHISGAVADDCHYGGVIGEMHDCDFEIILNEKVNRIPLQLTAIGGEIHPPTLKSGSFSFNRLHLSGNQDVSPIATDVFYVGHLSFFHNMDLRITTNLTGKAKCAIDTAGSFVNERGVTSDSDIIIDRNRGSSIEIGDNNYMLPRSMVISAEDLSPLVNQKSTLGTNNRRYQSIHMGSGGLHLLDANGGRWSITVSIEGKISVNKH
ncbi:phage tailspike protein [Xenorhabdus bovienii]|uniref:Bacteriophage P22 tailspike N-terminal domain-containing protein n=1 Tax=Xenorhabdus bovienii str. feltiae Moldova TaxID=1398200 RepID=A0A077NV99_XENBV|nr:phage tailspike protein [Xenorhabdus bovienii]CDH01536.1 hypothetical protein XBFM1_2200016 [Xenorhabdus bovienii str. feltiae Moldova]